MHFHEAVRIPRGKSRISKAPDLKIPKNSMLWPGGVPRSSNTRMGHIKAIKSMIGFGIAWVVCSDKTFY